jgi:hypothetical protein
MFVNGLRSAAVHQTAYLPGATAQAPSLRLLRDLDASDALLESGVVQLMARR